MQAAVCPPSGGGYKLFTGRSRARNQERSRRRQHRPHFGRDGGISAWGRRARPRLDHDWSARDPPLRAPCARRRPDPAAVDAGAAPADGARQACRSDRLARASVPARLGQRASRRRSVGGRLRPAAAGEARTSDAGLAFHPHPLRVRIPLGPRAFTQRRSSVHIRVTTFGRIVGSLILSPTKEIEIV